MYSFNKNKQHLFSVLLTFFFNLNQFSVYAQNTTAATISTSQATESINALCKQMSYMPGCSVQSMCKSNSAAQSKPFCQPVSNLADICALDMPRMSDCKTYTDICFVQSTTGGKVQFFPNSSSICSENLPITSLPTTNEVNNQITSICKEMDMEGCSSCKINPSVSSKYLDCDQLKVYSDLCIAMPEMNQCASWKAMCGATPDLPYCQPDIKSPTFAPTMKMFFHTGFSEYVLFKEWVPTNQSQYSWTCFALFVLSIIYEGLIALHAIFEVKWTLKNKEAACFPAKFSKDDSSNNTLISIKLGRSWKTGLVVAFGRAGFKFINATLGYSLMLVTMTFNVGLFFSVISGMAAGTLFFGGFIRKAQLSGKIEDESPTGCC